MSNKIKQKTVMEIDNYVVLSMLRKMGIDISIEELYQRSSLKIKEEVEKALRIDEPERFYGLESISISLDKRAFNNGNIEYCTVEFYYKDLKIDYFEDFLIKLRTPISVVFAGISPRIVNRLISWMKGKDTSIHEFIESIGSVEKLPMIRGIGDKVAIPEVKKRLAEWGYTK